MSMGRKIEIYAEVTESQASETNSDTAFADVVLSNIKVEVLYGPKAIKPGLTYQALVSDILFVDIKLLFAMHKPFKKIFHLDFAQSVI